MAVMSVRWLEKSKSQWPVWGSSLQRESPTTPGIEPVHMRGHAQGTPNVDNQEKTIVGLHAIKARLACEDQ
jgi:hypothetical protein